MSRATEEQIELLRAHERWFVEAEDSTAVALRALLDERTELLKDRERIERALRNASMISCRAIRRYRDGAKICEDFGHILRFCEEAGIQGSILRDAAVPKSEEKPK